LERRLRGYEVSAVLTVIDCETGGLDPKDHCIIDLAAQVVEINGSNLDPGAFFQAKIKPDRPVSRGAAQVNGYTARKWKNAARAHQVLGAFNDWLASVISEYSTAPMWCGANPLFDLRFYNSDRKRFGLPLVDGLHYRTIDIQSMAFPLLVQGKVKSLSLSSLRTWAGCSGKQKHTAQADVMDTCQVLAALLMPDD
jgi:DNA polymerase III alpha subunit (gram-positive type)